MRDELRPDLHLEIALLRPGGGDPLALVELASEKIALIVEDSAEMAETLAIALMSVPRIATHVVASAPDAVAFLNGTGGGTVCAVLTDINLPGMDGYELISAIRGGAALRARLPILVISGETDPGAGAKALSLGANAFFAKPCSPGEVRKKLEELIDAA